MASLFVGKELYVDYLLDGSIREVEIPLGTPATDVQLIEYLKAHNMLNLTYWDPPPYFPAFIVKLWEDGKVELEDDLV